MAVFAENVKLKYDSNGRYSRGELAINASGNDVKFTLETNDWSVSGTYRWYWTARLQRLNGTWQTVGTRTGYVDRESPSHRTFTNVQRLGKNMRIRIDINKVHVRSIGGWGMYSKVRTIIWSKFWKR